MSSWAAPEPGVTVRLRLNQFLRGVFAPGGPLQDVRVALVEKMLETTQLWNRASLFLTPTERRRIRNGESNKTKCRIVISPSGSFSDLFLALSGASQSRIVLDVQHQPWDPSRCFMEKTGMQSIIARRVSALQELY
jgi:hypothetical protein